MSNAHHILKGINIYVQDSIHHIINFDKELLLFILFIVLLNKINLTSPWLKLETCYHDNKKQVFRNFNLKFS